MYVIFRDILGMVQTDTCGIIRGVMTRLTSVLVLSCRAFNLGLSILVLLPTLIGRCSPKRWLNVYVQ